MGVLIYSVDTVSTINCLEDIGQVFLHVKSFLNVVHEDEYFVIFVKFL
jgi:hypothetical protein